MHGLVSSEPQVVHGLLGYEKRRFSLAPRTSHLDGDRSGAPSLSRRYHYTMSSPEPPKLTSDILQQRLVTGQAVPGGSRSSLTRVATKLAAAAEEDSARAELENEIQLAQLELHKLLLCIEQQQAEHDTLVETTIPELESKVETQRQETQEARLQASTAAWETHCWQQYEGLAKTASTRYPTSSRSWQQQRQDLLDQCEQSRQELSKLNQEWSFRAKQFQLFLATMQDLKSSLEGPVDPVDLPEEVPEEDGEEAGAKAMEVEDGEEDEEALYGDL